MPLNDSQQAAAAVMAAAGYQPRPGGNGPGSPGLNPQQQVILDAFSTETYVANRIDVQHEPIWDTIAFSNGATTAASFYGSTGYPIGCSATLPNNGHVSGTADTLNTNNSQFFVNLGSQAGKTPAQCGNLATSKRLDAPEAFAIFGFRLFWNETISYYDLQFILNNFALQFIIGQKAYNTGPLRFYQAGGGISGFSSNSSTQFLTNGVPGREAMHKLAIPLVIENQASFFGQFLGNSYVVQTSTAGGQGVQIQLLLDGLHARGVQ